MLVLGIGEANLLTDCVKAGQDVLCQDVPGGNNPGGNNPGGNNPGGNNPGGNNPGGNNPGGNNPGGNNPGGNNPGGNNPDNYDACPKGLYSNPQCCATDVLGVADLNCDNREFNTILRVVHVHS